MKKKFTIIMLLVSGLLIAQNGINYKALIKDNLGNPLINSSIQIQFEIHEDFDGLLVYSETHNINTDDNGVIVLTIGTGTPITGTYDDVFLSPNPTGLNVQVDIGSGLVDMGTSEFNYVPYAHRSRIAEVAQNITGLESIIEGGNFGWRLIGVNVDYYGNIGFQAVDLSTQTFGNGGGGATGSRSMVTGLDTQASGTASSAFGFSTEARDSYSAAFGLDAIADGEASLSVGRNTFTFGDYSLATGRETNANANYSVATGYQNTASGLYSFTGGFSTIASGNGAFSIGNNTSATGNNAFSMGLNNLATGNNSVALGFDTVASGNRSFAAGSNTQATSLSSFVIGRWNARIGNSDSWVTADPLFEIGIGTSSTNRDNAITVLKNGNVGVGAIDPEETLHVIGRVRIGTETIEDTGNNRLSFNADLLPDVNEGMQLGNSSFRWLGLWAADGTINTSDRRDKTNIKAIEYGLNEVLKMNPVSFNWKNRKNKDTKLGLIAQDLLELVPEVVKTHEWQTISDNENAPLEKVELKKLGVYYSDLIPVLINAIKEQNKIIVSQGKELKASNKNYEALLSRIEIIESKSSN